jgi:hypothetical protein
MDTTRHELKQAEALTVSGCCSGPALLRSLVTRHASLVTFSLPAS